LDTLRPPGGTLKASAAPFRILVVEDQPELRRLICMSLDEPGFELYEAPNGDHAAALIAECRPDAVVLDVMMPGAIDGLALCRSIRANPATAGIRVALLSARGQQDDRERGVQAGADAYLVKPFSPMELLELVRRWSGA
jgi:DNA-binding response OmpR family regulator